MNLPKTPYLVLFVLLSAIGITAASAQLTGITSNLENLVLSGQLDCTDCIDPSDISSTVLGELECSDEQVAKWTGLMWECADGLSCANQLILEAGVPGFTADPSCGQ